MLFRSDFAEDDTVFAATSKGLIASNDRGHNWAEIGEEIGRQAFQTVAITGGIDTPQTVIAVTIGGQIWSATFESA